MGKSIFLSTKWGPYFLNHLFLSFSYVPDGIFPLIAQTVVLWKEKKGPLLYRSGPFSMLSEWITILLTHSI